ncbi:ABC transporter permease [Proteus vulgaris]|uniref:ABC transporter permease n=1 Tax=Proteus vulgaris TaxID=585 RepID=UPI0023624016|nr:ABC transporter permease subunit [Proteus vulgaris]
MQLNFLQRFLQQRLAMTGVVIILFLVILGIFAPYLAPHDPYLTNVKLKLMSASFDYPLGTDQLGRCVFSRLIYGIRTSLSTAVLATALMLSIGIPLGILAGYVGGKTDNLIMRLVDIASTFPSSLLALAAIGITGPSLMTILLVFIALWWAPFARIIRGSVIALKEKDFIQAAVSVGSPHHRIIFHHIIPNAMSSIIVLATLRIAAVITHVAAFSFIGLGSQPPIADWGVMLSDSRQYMTQYPMMIIYPALAIMLSVWALNMIGEGLNDVLQNNAKALDLKKQEEI